MSPASSTYKLTYFNLMGRAEPTRLIFAQAGVQYEDNRVEKRDWPALKPKTPHGQLPVLEVNGEQLAQSRAIEKYLAKEFDLAGTNDWEAAKMDELVLCVDDLLNKMNPWFAEQDNAKKVEIFKGLCEAEITPFLTRFDSLLEKSKSGYFIGDKVSYADLAIFHIIWFVSHKILPGALKKYAHLYNFLCRISQMPNIKSWMDKRPKTEV